MALTKVTERIISDNLSISGIATASNFKTGTTNIHNVGVEAAGINVLGGDTPIGTGSTIWKDGGALFSGIVTATSFVGDGSSLTGVASTEYIHSSTNAVLSGIVTTGPLNSSTGNFSSNVTIDGNLGVAGTITYEDVARVDATGISTFREGFGVGPLAGIALTAYKDGSIRTSGIVTATTFVGNLTGNPTGSGANLTSIPAGQLTGALPAISGASLTGINTAFGSGTSVNTTGIITATAFVPSASELSHRNMIVNGAMEVAQRSTSVSDSDGFQTCDRVYLSVTGQGTDFQWTQKQTADGPPGFGKCYELDITGTNSLAAGFLLYLRYKIEAQDLIRLANGTSSAKPMTLSFWVKSKQTGTYQVSIHKEDNTVRFITATYAVSAADTWEQKSITFPGDVTGGGINCDNGQGFQIAFQLAAGTNFTSGGAQTAWGGWPGNAGFASGQAVNVADNTANYFRITGLQLEVGSVATPFEHRNYDDELRRCMRYYWQGTTSQTYYAFNYTGATKMMSIRHPVPMRAIPTFTKAGGDGGTYNTWGNSQSILQYNAWITSSSTDTNAKYFDQPKFSAEL